MKTKARRHLTLSGESDKLFDNGRYPLPFSFNREVAQVFDDMVQRSIPLYREVNEYVLEWALHYAQEDSRIYDIGCSTGTTLDLLGRHLEHSNVELIGIDLSESMIARASKKLNSSHMRHKITLIQKDIMDVEIKGASVVIVNYTLQFLPIHQRRKLLKSIYDGMAPGGLLFVSEKIRSPIPEFQETATFIYEGFKENQGYSRTEIERKKEALDQVLIPLTEEEQKKFIIESGFHFCESVIKWNNFVSLVALKGQIH